MVKGGFYETGGSHFKQLVKALSGELFTMRYNIKTWE